MAMKALLALAMATAGTGAAAELSGTTPQGFTVTHVVDVKATPARVFEAFGQVGRWWSDAHTHSGRASNLTLDPTAGGCFCERWDGASVEHARVVNVGRNAHVRLEGALGPLQELPVRGVLTMSVKAGADERSTVRFVYRVGGPPEAGLDRWAAPVDQVLGEQLVRLARHLEGR
jgi:uncharacterized protein YndB with AHSA1/START domain